MKVNIICFLFLLFFLSIGCGSSKKEEVKPKTETKNFVYISVPGNTTDINGISVLNQWLKENSEKKVISFTGILAYREGVSGYAVYFTHGDNSKQRFEQISGSDVIARSRETVFGIDAIQLWMGVNHDRTIIAFSSVPSYSGGVREYVICSE